MANLSSLDFFEKYFGQYTLDGKCWKGLNIFQETIEVKIRTNKQI